MHSINKQMDVALCDMAIARSKLDYAEKRLCESQELFNSHLASLNLVQKRIDELVEYVKKDSPTNSNWTRPDPVHLCYAELLQAVVRKYDNETRHQTALRYITEEEQTEVAFNNDSIAWKCHP